MCKCWSYLIRYPDAGALNSKQRLIISTIMFCGMCLVDNSETLESCVYPSAAVLAGGGVGFVGDGSGLVSTGFPFRRPALTSANLHECAEPFGFVYSSECAEHHMGLFKHVVYHGFSSAASRWGSLRRCSQLPSSFSLVRTLVVRNTVALSPSETKTCSSHTPSHHLRYYMHCKLHHNNILISIWMMPLQAHAQYIMKRFFILHSIRTMSKDQRLQSHQPAAETRPRLLLEEHVLSHSDHVSRPAHLVTCLFWRLLPLLCSLFFTGHLKNILEPHPGRDRVKKKLCNLLRHTFKMVVPTPRSLPKRNMCSVENSSVSSFRHADDPVQPL